MLVFSKARLVFLSVPKTGSTAYQQALAPMASLVVSAPPELKHSPVYRYNSLFRPMLEKFVAEKLDILAVVREPVSWLGSWYRYRQRPDLAGKPNATHDISFDAFVQAYCRKSRPGYAQVGSQARFLRPTPNGTAAKYLFRYEDQEGLIRFLENRLQAGFSVPHANASSGTTPKLTSETATKLQHVAADDFALWQGIGPRGISGRFRASA